MMAIRNLSPGGYEYLTGSVACADRPLEPGESLSDYYMNHGYPAGYWLGAGAQTLGLSGEVTAEQMNALFGEGRHPDANRIEAEMIAAGASPETALKATKLGRRFPRYGGVDELRSAVIDAYKGHNLEHGRPIGAPIDEQTRARIRRKVQADSYAEAHEGRRPSDAELKHWLAEQRREMKSATSGYELVFAPAKSVSVVWALGDEATRELIVNAHREAVHGAVAYLQSNAAFTRKGSGGFAQHDVRGIAAAAFEHWDSRCGDMHLHTHVPVSAKVQGTDGSWTSLDGRTLLAASVTASEYYDSRMRDLLREHGARWNLRPRNGLDLKRMGWELEGVPEELLRGFSQRTSAVEQARAARIVAFRHEHGREPDPGELRELSRRAKYDGREGKQEPRTFAEHMQVWRQQATGMFPSRVVDSLGRRVFGGTPETVTKPDVAELAAATLASVSDHYSHFNKWNILAEAHRQSAHVRIQGGTRDQLVSEIADRVIADRDTIMLHTPALVDEPSTLCRSSGESVFVEHNSQRYTTERTLREEQALAAWGNRRDGVRLSETTVNRALAQTGLNPGQQRAVSGFAESGRRVQLLYAPAGTGKTTAMRVFAQAWRSEAGRVIAFGPSARAAQELGDSIGAKPHTLHELTTALRLGTARRKFGFSRGDVLIIDEVAMSGTHTLHDAVAYALRCGADVRLVGDDRQLGAVEAGGAVRWFAHRNSVLRLHEVVRFQDPQQAAASLKLHDRDPAGLDYHFEQGWVSGGSLEVIRDDAHRAWHADLDQGIPSLLIVPRNDDVIALNHQARELRLAHGDVESGRAAQLHDGTLASTGDWIVSRRNDRLKTLFGGRDFVKNGDVWTVKAIRRDGALKVRHRAKGATTVLPAEYVAAHVELAYASTLNRSQGMSIRGGNAHGVAPQGLSAEQLYTLVTRAECKNRIYVETHQHTVDSHQETPPEQNERAVLESMLARSSAETSATEELRASLAKAESLRTLVGRYDYVAHLNSDKRIDAVLTEHAPAILDFPAAPALQQTLRNAQDRGWQAQHLLSTALAEGSLADADDPAAVLQWRIHQRVLAEQPPQRIITAPQTAIGHWRTLIERHAPHAATSARAWEPVWQHAAAAADEGLDTNTAINYAAKRLAARPVTDPTQDHDYFSQVLTLALARERTQGAGWQPALPWMAQPDYLSLTTGEADYLQLLGEAISNRATELRLLVTSDPPAWTAGFGPRPENSESAKRWDHLIELTAAYRETYSITTTNPETPLGEQPDSDGLRAHAWHELTSQWETFAHTQSAATTADDSGVVEVWREEFGIDELLSSLEEPFSTREEEPLDVLLAQHQRASNELIATDLTARAQEALTEHAPQVIGKPGETALLNTLRRAENLGWQAERLLPQAIHERGLHSADDPATVLRWRLEKHLSERQPPAPVAPASPEQVMRWATLISESAPAADTTTWDLVWRHAAAGARDGLDPDTAMRAAAHHLADESTHDAASDRRFAAQIVVDELAHQRQQGAGWQPVLPWMPRPHHTEIAGKSALADYTRQLTDAMQNRIGELRESVAREQPSWIAGFGPRPANSEAAQQWENLIELAAAYRETYGITTTNPKTPLGPSPGRTGAKAEAWRIITEQWSPTMTDNAGYYHNDNQARLDALRDQIDESRDDHRDEHIEAREDRYDENIDRRADYEDYDQRRDEAEERFHTGMGL